MKNSFFRSALRWFRFRGLALAAVFFCGYVAFLMGVGVSDRAGVPDADPMTKLYYTLGLFVLGGMDLGVPTGGPSWARGLLWTAYFAAPLVTASAVIEGVLRIIDPQTWRLRRMRDHVVIAGAGNLALLYLERLRSTDRNVEVVVVEKNLDATHIDLIQNRFNARILRGDIANMAVMESVNLGRARRVMFLTGDDFANLEAATNATSAWEQLRGRIVVHVADIMLRRVLDHTESLGAELFNSHQKAAQALVEKQLKAHFRDTPNRDQVVLAGFGRFGQTVLDELIEHCEGEFDRVVILDIKAERWFTLFSEHRGPLDMECYPISGDMTDPAVWAQVDELIDFSVSDPVVVLGSDRDELNIQVALWLRARLDVTHPGQAKMFVRCFQNTKLAQQLGKERNFEVVSVAKLISGAMGKWV